LLAAIEKRSNFTFTFEIIHWIAHVTKILVAITTAPACDEDRKRNISEHASWLISVLSWVPQEPDVVSRAENSGMTEMLFEVALHAVQLGNIEVFEAARETLVSWSFKGGRHHMGRGILERSMCGLATLALWKDDTEEPARLKQIIRDALAAGTAPDQEQRDRAARGIREKAMALRTRAYARSSLESAINQVDPKQMRSLLQEIANLLSPHTAEEPVRRPFF
jgi:hypothetical protein